MTSVKNDTGAPVDRRAVLKSIGLIGFALTPFQTLVARARTQNADIPPTPKQWNGEPLGRITTETLNSRVEPTTDSGPRRDVQAR